MGPKAPDPAATAKAQQESNIGTAVAQTGLNAQNQVTPYGSLSYEQIGAWPDGTPRFQSTTSLSPTQTGLLKQQERFGGLVNELGIGQAERLTGHLDQPFNLDDPTIGQSIMTAYQPRFDEQRARELGDLETRLVNKGIRPGSTAWDREMARFDQSFGDRYNQLQIGARGQAVNELLAERNQPINEIMSLMSGGQVTQPQFQSTPQTGVANTDVAGIMQNSYAQQAAQRNAMLGGLAGLGSAAISGWAMSDRDVKEDVSEVGKLDDGTKVFAFRYKNQPGMMRLGLMAGDAKKRHPGAVARTARGLEAVNYSRIAEALAA